MAALSQEEVVACSSSNNEQGTTSLIKSLLATKVTQRQQQQKLLQKVTDVQQPCEDNANLNSALMISFGLSETVEDKDSNRGNVYPNTSHLDKITSETNLEPTNRSESNVLGKRVVSPKFLSADENVNTEVDKATNSLSDDALVESTSKNSNDDNSNEKVSLSAANLYAALAADALGDQAVEIPVAPQTFSQNQQRQIVLTASAQLAQRIVVNGQQYVVTQPQNALLQGQTQTVLLAQTTQSNCSTSKRIIILQPQNIASGNIQGKELKQHFQCSHPSFISSPHSPAFVRSPSKTCISHASRQLNIIKSATAISTNSSDSFSHPALVVSGLSSSVSIPPVTPMITLSGATASSTKSSHTPEFIITSKPPEKGNYTCDWRGCSRSFVSCNQVYLHACQAHCPQDGQETQCLWQSCDSIKRKRFSLMTHLYERHCSPDVMRMMGVKRKHPSISCGLDLANQSSALKHSAYTALNAIKQQAFDSVSSRQPKEENESPVTKSIRLTAALILRNLVIFSANGRRQLTRFEAHLANVALSSVESSRTLAQILYDMTQTDQQ